MDALLSVYSDGRTEHDDGLVALAPTSGGGQRAVAEQRRPGELRPHSRREACRAAGGRRWSDSALRGQADWRSSGGRGAVRRAVAEQRQPGELRCARAVGGTSGGG